MNILIADDHPVVRAGLRRLLAGSPEDRIAEATSGSEVLSMVRTLRPDLVILDINLPGVGGLELLRRLTAADPAIRILVFSMHGEPVYAIQALRAGAQGYISKLAPPEEILEAVRLVAGGDSYVERRLAQELALQAIPERQQTATPLPSMTPRDLELLRLVGQGSSLSEMAAATGVSYKTTANKLTLLKARLGVSTTAELVRLAVKTGIAP
jgi:DNA-binding NarL/FixJ family response regulator